MDGSYCLRVWYEMFSTPHEYKELDNKQIEELIESIKCSKDDPGIKNRALRYEVIFVNVTKVDSGVF